MNFFVLYIFWLFLKIFWAIFHLVTLPKGGISEHKAPFAQDHAPLKDLAEIVKAVRPTCLIGAAAIGGVFTKDIIEGM